MKPLQNRQQMRDITNKTDGAGDTLGAGDFNSFNDELENLVRSSGETLDLPGGPDSNLFMLAQTIATYAASTYKDTGSANAYVLGRHELLKDPYLGLPTVLIKACILKELSSDEYFDESLKTAEDIDL